VSFTAKGLQLEDRSAGASAILRAGRYRQEKYFSPARQTDGSVRFLYCIDIDNGTKTLWKKEYPSRGFSSSNDFNSFSFRIAGR